DATVAGCGKSYLVAVGPAYAFLGMGPALSFAAQGRGRMVQPLLATLARLLVAGALGALALGALGWGIDSLFGLMACGLASYGVVMLAVMRRGLGLCGGAGWLVPCRSLGGVSLFATGVDRSCLTPP